MEVGGGLANTNIYEFTNGGTGRISEYEWVRIYEWVEGGIRVL
jgi:hypothetical protein